MTGTGQGQPYLCYDVKKQPKFLRKVEVSRWRQAILDTY